MNSVLNIYCDESCHLEKDHSDVMVIGGISCPKDKVSEVSRDIIDIKKKYNLTPPSEKNYGFEIKWVKVSPAKLDFYEEVLEYFFKKDYLTFRGVIVPNKKKLRHHEFNQSHDDFYYKMFYFLLRKIVSSGGVFNVYLDIKDTNGGIKTRVLKEYLEINKDDPSVESIISVEQIRSDESVLLQLTDLIIGAIAYFNRGLESSSAKLALVEKLRRGGLGRGRRRRQLNSTSYYSERKFNILYWKNQEPQDGVS